MDVNLVAVVVFGTAFEVIFGVVSVEFFFSGLISSLAVVVFSVWKLISSQFLQVFLQWYAIKSISQLSDTSEHPLYMSLQGCTKVIYKKCNNIVKQFFINLTNLRINCLD